MNAKKTVGRSALSCEVEDGLLDIDQILNTEPWTQIDDFVQHNFLQNILNEFNEQIKLDPERAPKEETKKRRTVQSKRTPRKKEEASDENRASNSKASGGEKLKDKIEKSSIRKQKNKEKSNGDSGKIEKKKGMACASKKDVGKSTKDQKTEGNSSGANPSSTVTMSNDESEDCETRRGTSIVEEMAEPMEGTHEMETWQDVAGVSFETTVPRGESSRIDEVTLPRNLIVTDCPNVSKVRSETITNDPEEKRKETRSLRRSRSECSDGERHLLENTAEKEISPDDEFDESKRRKRQPAGKSRCLQDKSVAEKNISKLPEGKGSGRKFLRRSKCSDEKDDAEKIVEKNISTSHEETDVEKKTGRKSLRRSKCSEEENPAEKQISDDEGCSGQTKAKRRSLEASKSSKGKESAEKIAEKNITTSHEETDAEKKTGRKSLRRPKCLEEQNPAEKQISDDEGCSGQTKAKRRSLETPKSSKGKESTKKIAEKNITTSHEETDAGKKRASKSLGTSTCLEEENSAEKQISDDEGCSGQTKAKRRSLETPKSSKGKESTKKIAEKNITTSHEVTDAGKKRASKSLGTSTCLEEQNSAKKQISGDEGCCGQTRAKRKSLEASKSSKDSAEMTAKKHIPNEEKDPAKKRVKKKTETDSKCSRRGNYSAKKEKDKKTKEEKPRKKRDDKSVATKDKKIGKYERLLLEKRKRRVERRIRRRERQANRAMATFGHCVTSIVKKMGYVEESQLELNNSSDSSDSSDSCDSSDSSHSSDSSDLFDSDEISSDSFTTCYSTSSSITTYTCSCSSDYCCSQDFSSCSGCSQVCSDPDCRYSSPCSCIDFTDTSDVCSEVTSSTD